MACSPTCSCASPWLQAHAHAHAHTSTCNRERPWGDGSKQPLCSLTWHHTRRKPGAAKKREACVSAVFVKAFSQLSFPAAGVAAGDAASGGHDAHHGAGPSAFVLVHSEESESRCFGIRIQCDSLTRHGPGAGSIPLSLLRGSMALYAASISRVSEPGYRNGLHFGGVATSRGSLGVRQRDAR